MNASERDENIKKINHIRDDDNEYNSRTLEQKLSLIHI